MLREGFIKLHRSMLDWQWFKNKNIRLVFMYILLSANYRDKQWENMTIRRGQLFASYASLAEHNGVSIQQARTAVAKLKSTGEITTQATARGLLITVNNYAKYQSPPESADRAGSNAANMLAARPGHAATVPPATTKESKKEKKTAAGHAHIAYFERNIGKASPSIIEDANRFMAKGMEQAVVLRAMREAVDMGVHNWKYIKRILQRWLAAGLTTVSGLDAAQGTRAQRGKKSASFAQHTYTSDELEQRKLRSISILEDLDDEE